MHLLKLLLYSVDNQTRRVPVLQRNRSLSWGYVPFWRFGTMHNSPPRVPGCLSYPACLRRSHFGSRNKIWEVLSNVVCSGTQIWSRVSFFPSFYWCIIIIVIFAEFQCCSSLSTLPFVLARAGNIGIIMVYNRNQLKRSLNIWKIFVL